MTNMFSTVAVGGNGGDGGNEGDDGDDDNDGENDDDVDDVMKMIMMLIIMIFKAMMMKTLLFGCHGRLWQSYRPNRELPSLSTS